MSLTVSTSYNPIPDKAVLVTFTATAGNYVRVWCTDAPLGGKIKSDIDQDANARVRLYEGATTTEWEVTFDQPGQYVLSIDEITKGASTYGGGYAGAPDSYQSETVNSTLAYSMTVGNRVTCRVGTPNDYATLVLWVWGTDVEATSVAVHGEKTPALIDPTGRAATAILASAVIAQLNALAGVAASTMCGTPTTVFNDVQTQFNAHLSHAGHASSDSDNTVDTDYANPTVPDKFAAAVGELQRRLRQHEQNDDGTGVGTAGYHTVADNFNAQLEVPVGSILNNTIALADAWRVYEAHRVQTSSVHSPADTTNTCAALPALLNLHRLVLAELADSTPTAGATENSGVVTLRTLAGME